MHNKEDTYLRKISLSGMMLPLVGFALRLILKMQLHRIDSRMQSRLYYLSKKLTKDCL